MQNVSPGAGNKGAGRDVAEGKIGNHVTVTGIVNVEQKISSSGELSVSSVMRRPGQESRDTCQPGGSAAS
jgi:hypothetical protein